MPNAITRGETTRGTFTLSQAVQDELERLRDEGQLGDGAKTEPRCFICGEVESKKLVNKLLAAGLTNREIAESCEFINKRRRAVGDERLIEAAHVYRHRREHFNVDDPAQAVYRSIVEREAEDANLDHINGVGTAVSPYAVLRTVMVKGFGHIATSETSPSVTETMAAATKLHELTSRDAGQKKMADLLFLMDRIIAAAQQFIPVEDHEAFLSVVEGRDVPLLALSEKVHQVAVEGVRTFVPKSSTDDDDLL